MSKLRVLSIPKSSNKKKMKRIKFDKDEFLKQYNLETLSLLDVECLLNKKLNKEQLLLIAEKRFGIPRGSNLRISKEELLVLIKKAMDYNASLESIKQKASE